MHIHINSSKILFSYRLSQNIEYCYLCYLVSSCWLSILYWYIIVCVNPTVYLPLLFIFFGSSSIKLRSYCMKKWENVLFINIALYIRKHIILYVVLFKFYFKFGLFIWMLLLKSCKYDINDYYKNWEWEISTAEHFINIL